MTQRHFLFLQGLPGPSLWRIARRIGEGGHRASRINFNGGDLADWGWSGTAYRGSAEAFGPWLECHCRDGQVSDLVLFGERRPLHVAAIAVARALGLDVHILEEGYLRPNSVAIERWQRGSPWQAPASLEHCRLLGDGGPGDEVPIENRFARRWRESVTYWTVATLLWPAFPRYRSHRVQSTVGEVRAWLRRYASRGREHRASAAALADLGDAPFFLFPLQLDGDSQLVFRSPFDSMRGAAQTVLDSFARCAPEGVRLLVKRHPYDPDPLGWRRWFGEATAALGIGARVHFVEHADLDPLLERCLGVMTINSTVGGLALRIGKPVHALGQALYAMPGLASAGPPDSFWTAPGVVSAEDFAAFSAALWRECLVNAGFHSEDALARLERAAAARLIGEGTPCAA